MAVILKNPHWKGKFLLRARNGNLIHIGADFNLLP